MIKVPGYVQSNEPRTSEIIENKDSLSNPETRVLMTHSYCDTNLFFFRSLWLF